jgi:hypothetical protein
MTQLISLDLFLVSARFASASVMAAAQFRHTCGELLQILFFHYSAGILLQYTTWALPGEQKMEKSIPTAMEEIYRLVNSTPSTDAADILTRFAATMPPIVAITALARLYVLMAARVRHADAKIAE